jgi:colicin import membrane protein
MNVQTVPRTALDSYLKLLRVPTDLVLKALSPRNRNGETTPAELVVDRAEAAVRDAVGRVFNDAELQADARRRRAAADERQRALRLRAAAEHRSEQADETLGARQEAAEERREEAADRERTQKQRSEQRRAAESRQLAQAEERKRASVRAQANRAEKAIEDQARGDRLEQLDAEARTLDEEEEALTARSEAQRLRRAAAETKTQRKRSG